MYSASSDFQNEGMPEGAGAFSDVTDVMRTSGKVRSDCAVHDFISSAPAGTSKTSAAAKVSPSGKIVFILNLYTFVQLA
jgi:hypothetical protein